MFFTKLLARAALAALAAAATLGVTPAVQAQGRISMTFPDDDTFRALRDAARADDAQRAYDLAARLSNYPIRSYVDYYRIKPRIKTLPVAEIRDFLARYDGSAIADRLRNDWLLEVGKGRDWATFDEQYPQFVLDDDTQLKCYALMSRAAKNQNVANDARALL
ncbi:MAG: lytic transglycosylase domain-containing protein, partial [Janthinobacterium lividum]